MSTLPYQDIKKLIEDKKIIENSDIQSCLGPASYELRVGSAMSLTDQIEHPIDVGIDFAIKPQSHLLIGTMEKIKLPNNICADLSLKSKFGRRGFLPWSQGFVDPGYQGKLTISLINMSPHPVILTGGQRICHMVLRQLKEPTQKPYDGEYNRSTGATGPKGGGILVLGTPLREALVATLGGLASGIAQGVVS